MVSLARRLAHALSDFHPVRRARFAAGCAVQLGKDVHLGRGVVFRCERVVLGDGVVIGDNVTVEADVFELGDFGTIQSGCFFPGPGKVRIGHNFQLGRDSVVDAMGGTVIGDHVGVGARSQLWTHMKHGDVAYGCRFHSAAPLTVEDDVWLAGRNLVSPGTLGARSMAMPGSLITRDMAADRTYAGSPAVDVTDSVGPQFAPVDILRRVAIVEEALAAFGAESGEPGEFRVVTSAGALEEEPGRTTFHVEDRTYTKRGTAAERRCLRWLLSRGIKFRPVAAQP